jgi:predicted RNA-binding protein with PIN domain
MLDGAVAEPIVLVDARNVIRSRWPNLGEDWFLERTRAWAEREGVRALVVFDRRAPAWVDDERLTAVGTASRTADDVIAEEAARRAGEGRVWVVTSDRGLRARVAPVAERTIGGGAFAGELEAL